MTLIKDIRSSTHLSQAQFGAYLGIPQRTIESWESGSRKCPQYVLNLIRDKVKNDNDKADRDEFKIQKMILADDLGYIDDSMSEEEIREIIRDNELHGYLTTNYGRNGHWCVWYFDENHDICYDINDERYLSNEEIEKNFC